MSKYIPEKSLQSVVQMLKVARTQQGLSHEKLAEKIGIHRSAISLIESEKRSPTLVICLRIARGLGIKLSILLSEIGE